MVKSMFAAIAGLKAHQSRLDVISNNVANVNTWGYKTKSANFADSMYQNVISGSGGTGATGGMNSSQLGYGVNMGSISADYTTGSRNPTGNGWHCMVDGPSFFIVGSEHAAITSAPGAQVDLTGEGLYLSRVGIFGIDNNGYLVDDQGNYVYGLTVNDQGDADPTNDISTLDRIKVDPAENYQSYKISSDGTLIGVKEDGTPEVVGQIAVATVENPNGLEQKAGYLYGIGANAGDVTATFGGSDAVGKVLSGYLEMSNVDLATEIANMITTQRGYQANSKIVTITDEMLEQLVNMKR